VLVFPHPDRDTPEVQNLRLIQRPKQWPCRWSLPTSRHKIV
jgi:hypothetical protein